MSVRFFGQYLLEKNIITTRQLIEAAEYQESRNLRFGEYAKSKGYLTDRDIHRIQAEQKRSDLFFGEVAVRLGILTVQQVSEILTMQRNDHIYIGAVLVQRGFITREALERELALFKEDQSKYSAGEVSVPAGAGNADAIKDMVNITMRMLKRMAGMNVKPGEGYLSANEPEKNFAVVTIVLSGSHRYEYILSVPLPAAVQIASGVIGENASGETDEVIVDGVKEFCNIVCGNIAAKMAQRGKDIDIYPPEEAVLHPDGYSLIRGRKAVCYPIASPEGEMVLMLVH